MTIPNTIPLTPYLPTLTRKWVFDGRTFDTRDAMLAYAWNQVHGDDDLNQHAGRDY